MLSYLPWWLYSSSYIKSSPRLTPSSYSLSTSIMSWVGDATLRGELGCVIARSPPRRRLESSTCLGWKIPQALGSWRILCRHLFKYHKWADDFSEWLDLLTLRRGSSCNWLRFLPTVLWFHRQSSLDISSLQGCKEPSDEFVRVRVK
jgi:hypothetical protein